MSKRNFIWESPYFNNMNESTLKFSKKLVDEGFILDVFLRETSNGTKVVCIQTIVSSNCNFQKDFYDKTKGIKGSIREFVVPLDFKADNGAGCKDKINYDCKFFGCPIIIAGYIYHNERNLKNDVVKKLFEKDKGAKTFEGLSEEQLLKQFMTDDFGFKHDEALNIINNEVTVPEDIKKHFYKVLKILDSYKEVTKTYVQDRPNLNFTLIDNTDTNNKICIGQKNCINTFAKILEIEGFLDRQGSFDSNFKYVDFKNITPQDAFKEENYKAPIIVLHNIFYMTSSATNGGSAEQVQNESIVRSGFPEFIINNSHEKIFIICDKEANIKLLYSNLPQLKLIFNTLKIPDLTIDEIYELSMLKFVNHEKGISVDDEFKENFRNYLDLNYIYAPYKNLEFIDFIYNDALKKSLLSDHPSEIHMDNLEIFRLVKNAGAANLQELIGLDTVKNEIKNLETALRYTKEKEKLGEKMPKMDLHMCFLGNPGTGKTTVARFMADILFNLEYIRYNKCIECEAKDLIANVPGQTAMKTSEIIQKALGGILFVDEAYAIKESEYGSECVAALIKSMEDYRDDLVVILAGYNKEMSQFLQLNSGFQSRINFYFRFEDYSNEELFQMFEKQLAQYGFRVKDIAVQSKVSKILDQEKLVGSGFGNSRYIRNLVDITLRQHAINTVRETDKELKYHIITAEDVRRKQSLI